MSYSSLPIVGASAPRIQVVRRSRRSRRSLTVACLATLALLVPMLSLASWPASADTAPLPPVTVSTVSADSLPTVQINGVVWDQVIVGNTVYATGEFTSARPAGSPAGTNETPRSNILAYNLTTGELITSWAPTLNAQGQSIVASTDGKRIFVAGSFTSVSGVNRYRVVALDATTGAVITSWNVVANARVRSLAVSGTTLYMGGIFSTVANQPRTRLAAVSTTTGALLPWAPTADAEVLTMTAPSGSGKVVAGGKFATVNGASAYGMASLDGVSGALQPWAIGDIVRNAGANAAIYSLTSDGARVYGSGYTYGTGGNFEGTFAANVSDGSEVYVTGCRGDTYDVQPIAGVLYSVGHPHDCAMIDGLPQTQPWTYQRAQAQTLTAASSGLVNHSGNFTGQPAPELLHWLPTLEAGTYTGSGQAAWTVEGNADYVVLGGEFPKVNNVAQSGLTRFAVRSIAPNVQGPQGGSEMTPTLLSLQPGRIRVSWKASWDRDNRQLTYQVLRGPLATATVVATLTQDSNWWTRPQLFFNDQSAAPGTTQTYRIRVKDALGNTVTGNSASITVPVGGTSSVYASQALADGATHLWRLGEPSGDSAYDYAAADDLALDSSATRGVDGAMINDGTAKATTFSGTATVPATSPSPVPGPNSFSEEAWFKTTSTTGGKIIGFGSSNTGNSTNYDRHVYMTNDGKIAFGVYTDGMRALTSSASYNDGQWHQVVANLGSTGLELFLDGKLVGRAQSVTSAQNYSGYWRIGGDNIGGWPGQPSNSSFTGSIEDVSIYSAPQPLTQVQSHYQASGRALNLPTRPTDAYGASVWDAKATLYWRLDDAAASTTAADRMTNDSASGTYSTAVVKGEPGAPAQPAGTSVRFPGDSAETLVSGTQVSNPTVYSLETWFKTTTTHGGRLIGFGDHSSGPSSNYDRHVYMLNDGRLRYGIYDGSTETIDSPNSYNDGQWHLLVATQGPNGEQLFVDGSRVATGTAVTPQSYSGYWRLGADNTWSGSDTNNFAGSFDEAAVYDAVLDDATIAQHYQLGKPAASNVAPTAAFSSTSKDLKVSFDGSGSSDPDGTIASYSWQFGDGSTGTSVSPNHTYTAAGTYDAVLTVTDDRGATGTITHKVSVTQRVNQAPTAAFGSVCTNLACTFDGTAATDSDGTIASYAWDFGDGSTSTVAKPSHSYASAGTRNVTLTVTDNDGATNATTQPVTVSAANNPPTAALTSACTALACTFDGTGSADSDGSIASYGWDFGDGTSGTGSAPAHTYPAAGSYSVVLTVTDNKGATGTASEVVTVTAANQAPVAAFSPTCTNLDCAFDASGSSDSDGSIVHYAWAFGDGSTGSQVTTTHSYATAGSYSVGLTVTDDKGATKTLTKAVTVTAAPVNQAPTAGFTSTCTNLVCSLDGSTSKDVDGTIAGYAWAFGDGASGTGKTPSHTFAAAGDYNVVLTVTDNQGGTNSITRVVTVTSGPVALASDAFERTVASGFGTADVGGSWAFVGAGTSPSVATGSGRISLPAGRTATFTLAGVQNLNTDLTHTVWAETQPTGGGVYLGTVVRGTSTGDYRARLKITSAGQVTLQLFNQVGDTGTAISSAVVVSGLTYTAGTKLRVRVQAQGSAPTTVQAKVWVQGAAEPASWTVSTTDSTAGLQVAGSVGLTATASGSATAALVLRYDDVAVTSLN